MPLAGVCRVYIHRIFEPPLIVGNINVASANLPLPHRTIFRESPVLYP